MRTGITKYALVLSVATSLTAFSAAARADDSSSASSTTSTSATKASKKAASFLKDAATDNQLEIALAELGSQKAQNADLKSLSQHVKADHTQAAQQLQPLAQKYGVALEQPEKQKEVTKLEKETGAEFDKKFAEAMLKTHQKNIEKFQKASTELEEADIKQFAAATLPKLHQHFQHAEKAAVAVGVDQTTISNYSKKVSGAMGGTSDESDAQQGTSGSSQTDKGAQDLKGDSSSQHSNH